ncbi:uncharacterized protein LACBIDRAFT_335487 [Laccaria bicolor S238N-H82]|uniref:Predicted protein n=1 Tax=Laccaria bicolor (strain S238N-H82 / ATCC MYA-4686) TaxID=486041 RepID=B0E2F0_LACBS|nr:uncharacterized protein LACBIDRAFT_335487 [Laccaria bicolor S238N-H82]EDQ98982.1 predicted protein [Laccaria bicolor S238N-H82]|eukprot:XP_001890384.1 predicted protein [Laccaria bicolor S238N-H82]
MYHQESSLSTAKFGRIWESTCGPGGRGRVGRGVGLIAEGAGVFTVIRGWGILWADSIGVGRWQFYGSSGVFMGGAVVMFAMARGGPVLVTFEASRRGARWEECPGGHSPGRGGRRWWWAVSKYGAEQSGGSPEGARNRFLGPCHVTSYMGQNLHIGSG